MYDRMRDLLLRFLKVPLEPHPPFGDPASLRVFRAGRNYFRLRLFGWGLGQAFALAGIIFWAAVFIQLETAAARQKQARAVQATTNPSPAAAAAPVPGGAPPGQAATTQSVAKARAEAWNRSVRDAIIAAQKHGATGGWEGFKQVLVELALVLPPWAFPLIWGVKILGFTIYLVQIPITYAVRRLDYEMHWYVVTDRSLRLRTGVWNVQELTMSFANLQQVVVTQGPLQRLLGLGDVRVESAGGAGSTHQQANRLDSLHSGHFHSVDNAAEIRDLILERLRRFRESGLGDPDEVRRAISQASTAPAPSAADADLLAAAREFRDEASALRRALG